MLTGIRNFDLFEIGTAKYWQNRIWPINISKNLLKIGYEQEEQEQELLESLKADELNEIIQNAMTENLVDSYAIEGERLDSYLVKSSIIESMGMQNEDFTPSSQYDDREAKAVNMTLSLMNNKPLTHQMIWQAHSLIENSSYTYRNHGEQVIARGKTIYIAPQARYLQHFMDRFLDWWHDKRLKLPAPVGSAIAHYLFVCIHPFKDGNGRMARALADKAMIISDQSRYRPYSIATAIFQNRDEYAIGLANLNPEVFINYMLHCHAECLQIGMNNARQMQFARYFLQRDNFSDIEKRIIRRITMQLAKNRNWHWEAIDFETMHNAPNEQDIIGILDDFKERGILSQDGIFNPDWYPGLHSEPEQKLSF